MEALLRRLPCLFSASLSHPVSQCSLVLCSWLWYSYSIFLTRMQKILYLLFHSLGWRVVSAHQFPGAVWFQSVFPHLAFISQGKIKIRKIKFSKCGTVVITQSSVCSLCTTWPSVSWNPVQGQALQVLFPLFLTGGQAVIWVLRL